MSTTLSSSAAEAANLVGNSRDLVGEILIRLPLSSVMRFRLVCKEWCSLTSTQSFIDMYENINQPGPPNCRSGNNNSCLVVQYCDNRTESKSDHFNILFFNLHNDDSSSNNNNNNNNNNNMKMKRIREYMHLSNIFSQVGEDGNGKMYKTVISNSFFHKMKAYYHIKLFSSYRGFLLFTAKPPPAAKIPVASCMANMFGGYWQPREEEYPALILYNPVTKEQLAVIAPPLKYVYCGFYYHSPTKEHRILYRVIEVDPHHHHEIAADGFVRFLVIELKNDYFMIRRINLKNFTRSSSYYLFPDTSTPPVISNGSLHWIVSEEDLHGHVHHELIPDCSHTILSFGMESEAFCWKPHPEFFHGCVPMGSNGHRHKMNLLEMEGGVLCLCDGWGLYDIYRTPVLDIYVMEDYEKWTWVRRYRIDLSGYIDIKYSYEYGSHYKALQILQGDHQLLLLLQVHNHPHSSTDLNVEFALYSLNHEKQLEGTFTEKKKNKRQCRFQVVIEECRPGLPGEEADQWFGILRRMRIKSKKVVGNMVVLTPSLASIFQRNRSIAPIGDPSTESPKHDAENESLRNPAIEAGNYVEPQLRKCETNVDSIRTPALDISSKEQPCLVVSSTNQTSSLGISSKEQPCPVSSTTPDSSTADTYRATTSTCRCRRVVQPRIHHPLLFTNRQISASISASENIRILCSITIAVLVVLSHLSFPFGSSSIVKSIIAFRPLYLVLLTNITIVFARLLSMKQRSHAQAPSEDASWADGLGKMFDLGLLMYKTFTAAFMDFSVYAVAVICGISLLQC